MRADHGNWLVYGANLSTSEHRNVFGPHRLILFDGEAQPQIVMGISAKPHQVINISRCKRCVRTTTNVQGSDATPALCSQRVPVIRRFTGGGTVITDHNTSYISLIVNEVRCL